LAGGDNNAYTTNDLTNYYITIPAENIETALWLESDRMGGLNLSQQALDVQKQVVIEEFKQRYLNKPYGDLWLKLRPLAYQVHPYRWPTIGISPEHIERATLQDVKEFFHRYYAPNNAIIAISGNIETQRALELTQKWFGDIPAHHLSPLIIPEEPIQQEARRMVLPNNDVPADAIYKVFHMKYL
jgi:predicted Zn-dependent peptidase